MSSACPPRAELREFVLGNLSRPAWQRVEEHVRQCPESETTLQEFDAARDPVLARLGELSQADGSADSQISEDLLQAARAGFRDQRAAFWSVHFSIVLDESSRLRMKKARWGRRAIGPLWFPVLK